MGVKSIPARNLSLCTGKGGLPHRGRALMREVETFVRNLLGFPKRTTKDNGYFTFQAILSILFFHEKISLFG